MTPEQQRIKIAEACGWTAEQDSNGYWRAVNKKHGNAVELWLSEQNVWSIGIPDYLNDLNACDGLINHMQTLGFDCVLVAEGFPRCCTFIDQERDIEFKVISSRFTYSICEAFLRTIGLWEEES